MYGGRRTMLSTNVYVGPFSAVVPTLRRTGLFSGQSWLEKTSTTPPYKSFSSSSFSHLRCSSRPKSRTTKSLTSQEKSGSQTEKEVLPELPNFRSKQKFNSNIYAQMYPSTIRKDIEENDWLRLEAPSTSSDTESTPDDAEMSASAEMEPLEFVQAQDEFEMRDVSKMNAWHRMLYHRVPPPMHVYDWQMDREALRERYAQFGRASGVNPGVMWPTESELLEQANYDQEMHPQFFATLDAVNQRKTQLEKTRQDRIKEVEEGFKQYSAVLEEYNSKLSVAEDERNTALQAKEAKIREIQEYFGYAVDPADPRFQDMLAKKEEEEKKAIKLAKKREKEQKKIAQLLSTAEAVASDK